MDKCTRCNKQATATITIDKPVYKSRVERFYTLCGYCMEDLEEFLQKPKGSEN